MSDSGMRRHTLVLVFALCIALAGAGCTRVSKSVDNEPSAAFAIDLLSARPCPDDRDATCFTVEIENIGERAGDGHCDLDVRRDTKSGQEVIGAGPTFRVEDMEPGERVRRTARKKLEHPRSEIYFIGGCLPGVTL